MQTSIRYQRFWTTVLGHVMPQSISPYHHHCHPSTSVNLKSVSKFACAGRLAELFREVEFRIFSKSAHISSFLQYVQYCTLVLYGTVPYVHVQYNYVQYCTLLKVRLNVATTDCQSLRNTVCPNSPQFDCTIQSPWQSFLQFPLFLVNRLVAGCSSTEEMNRLTRQTCDSIGLSCISSQFC